MLLIFRCMDAPCLRGTGQARNQIRFQVQEAKIGQSVNLTHPPRPEFPIQAPFRPRAHSRQTPLLQRVSNGLTICIHSPPHRFRALTLICGKSASFLGMCISRQLDSPAAACDKFKTENWQRATDARLAHMCNCRLRYGLAAAEAKAEVEDLACRG